MLRRLLERRSEDAAGATVGLAFGEGDVRLVAIEGERDGLPLAVAWDVLPFESLAELETALRDFVDRNGLRDRPCRAVLSPADYSLRLVERPPNLEDEELADATRWLLRDLIDFDVEDAELAIVPVPEHESRGRTPRIFAIAARRSALTELAHAIGGAGLALQGFEVVETSMLAFERRLPEAVAGGAMLGIDDKTSVLTLAKEERLYLTRPIQVDTDAIEAAARTALDGGEDTEHEIMSMLDGLLLDVQRSLDFYEGEYGQAPPSRLSLLPNRIDLLPLTPALSEAFRPMQIEMIELDRIVAFQDPPTAYSEPALSLAVGAAFCGDEPVGDALVPGAFKTRADAFGLGSAVRMVAAIALVLCVYIGFTHVQLGRARETVARLDAEHAALSDRVEALRAEAALRSDDTEAARALEQLREKRDARLAILRDLGQQQGIEGGSFSNILNALTRQDLEGVWLERITIADGGAAIALVGRTLSTADLPVFLRGLGSEASFEKRRFGAFRMEKTDPSGLGTVFRVATRRGVAEEGAEDAR